MPMLYILSALAVYRISLMVTDDHGPLGVFDKLRSWTSRSKYELVRLTCFRCTSVLVALPVSLLFTYWFITWFALAGAALIILELTEA